MSAALQWELLRANNCFVVRRSGITFSNESGNLVNKNSFKYSGLVHDRVVKVEDVATGVAFSTRSTKVADNRVGGSFPAASVIKANAGPASRAVKVGRQMEATGYRLDLVSAAQAKVFALLRSKKARKAVANKMRANKLAKLVKKD